MEIQVLHRQGRGVREIARTTGPYYPSAVYCDKAVFAAASAQSNGDLNQIVAACFAAGGVVPQQ